MDTREGTNRSHLIQQLKNIKNEISVNENLLMIDAKRIILPTNAIKPIMYRLHAGHAGQEKTVKLAQQLYYWQNITNDIKSIVDHSWPKQQTSPRVTKPPSSAYGAPMAHVGLNLFDYAGKKHWICVDKWSGFPLCKRLNSTTTQSIINVLETWFNILGWPSNIRSDGEPQFLGPFWKWCQTNNITHELSSPYNPKSNGLAEAGVKNVKLLLGKCSVTKEDPQRALYNWRNIPRKDG